MLQKIKKSPDKTKGIWDQITTGMSQTETPQTHLKEFPQETLVSASWSSSISAALPSGTEFHHTSLWGDTRHLHHTEKLDGTLMSQALGSNETGSKPAKQHWRAIAGEINTSQEINETCNKHPPTMNNCTKSVLCQRTLEYWHGSVSDTSKLRKRKSTKMKWDSNCKPIMRGKWTVACSERKSPTRIEMKTNSAHYDVPCKKPTKGVEHWRVSKCSQVGRGALVLLSQEAEGAGRHFHSLGGRHESESGRWGQHRVGKVRPPHTSLRVRI